MFVTKLDLYLELLTQFPPLDRVDDIICFDRL
jgi:hypothetical protein